MNQAKVTLVEDVDQNLLKLPPNLESLVSALENPNTNDCLVVVLYTLMIETGFIPSTIESCDQDASLSYGFNAKHIKQYNRIPDSWKDRDNSYEIVFQTCPISGHKFKLLVLVILEILIVDLYIEQHLHTDEALVPCCFAMTISPSDYVDITTGENDGCVQVKYKNVKDLAHKFKNTIASPALAFVFNDIGLTNPSLIGLPPEVRMEIFSNLKVQDIYNISMTCKLFSVECQDRRLWHQFVNRDWKVCKSWDEEIDWKLFYKQKATKSCNCSIVPGEEHTSCTLFTSRRPRCRLIVNFRTPTGVQWIPET